MQNEIALIQSRTFWSAFLALLAVIAGQFHWTAVLGFATDPNEVTNILNVVAAFGAFGAIVFRAVASKKITSAVTPGGSTTSAHAWLAIPLVLALLGLGGCALTKDLASASVTQNQLDSVRSAYDAAFLTPAAHYRKLGYCKTGTSATLALPCADRATVAKLQAADAAVAAAFNTLQADITANSGAAASDYTTLTTAISAAEQLAASLGVQ